MRIIRLLLLCSLVGGPMPAYAQSLSLPRLEAGIGSSQPYAPPVLKGLKIDRNNPFRFEFLIDKAQAKPPAAKDMQRLIQYFFAGMTLLDQDLWVNLSPYEHDRIIPPGLSRTHMGLSLLDQDHALKQLTASLVGPNQEVGRLFWKKLYEQRTAHGGTDRASVQSFQKVWIVPDTAVIFEQKGKDTAYVVEGKLKVLLEADYLAYARNWVRPQDATSDSLRKHILPALTHEVNSGETFAVLRQIYQSLILATWYKQKLKDGLLAQIYSEGRIKGIAGDAKAAHREVEHIYGRYLQSLKKGTHNFIREDVDPISQRMVPRKYFTGGMRLWVAPVLKTVNNAAMVAANPDSMVVEVELKGYEPTSSFPDIWRSWDARRSPKALVQWLNYTGPKHQVTQLVKWNESVFHADDLATRHQVIRLLWEHSPEVGLALLIDTAKHIRGYWPNSESDPTADKNFTHFLVDYMYLREQWDIAAAAFVPSTQAGKTFAEWIKAKVNDLNTELGSSVNLVLSLFEVFDPALARPYVEKDFLTKAEFPELSGRPKWLSETVNTSYVKGLFFNPRLGKAVQLLWQYRRKMMAWGHYDADLYDQDIDVLFKQPGRTIQLSQLKTTDLGKMVLATLVDGRKTIPLVLFLTELGSKGEVRLIGLNGIDEVSNDAGEGWVHVRYHQDLGNSNYSIESLRVVDALNSKMIEQVFSPAGSSEQGLTRRQFLSAAALTLAAAVLGPSSTKAAQPGPASYETLVDSFHAVIRKGPFENRTRELDQLARRIEQSLNLQQLSLAARESQRYQDLLAEVRLFREYNAMTFPAFELLKEADKDVQERRLTQALSKITQALQKMRTNLAEFSQKVSQVPERSLPFFEELEDGIEEFIRNLAENKKVLEALVKEEGRSSKAMLGPKIAMAFLALSALSATSQLTLASLGPKEMRIEELDPAYQAAEREFAEVLRMGHSEDKFKALKSIVKEAMAYGKDQTREKVMAQAWMRLHDKARLYEDFVWNIGQVVKFSMLVRQKEPSEVIKDYLILLINGLEDYNDSLQDRGNDSALDPAFRRTARKLSRELQEYLRLLKELKEVYGIKDPVAKPGSIDASQASQAGRSAAVAVELRREYTWKDLENEGYSFRIDPIDNSAFSSYKIVLLRNGQEQSRELVFSVFPSSKVLSIDLFYPEFDLARLGRGRALLVEILRQFISQGIVDEGYAVVASASLNFINSLKKIPGATRQATAHRRLYGYSKGFDAFVDRVLDAVPAGGNPYYRGSLENSLRTANYWGKIPPAAKSQAMTSTARPGGIDFQSDKMHRALNVSPRAGLDHSISPAVWRRLRSGTFEPVIVGQRALKDIRQFFN